MGRVKTQGRQSPRVNRYFLKTRSTSFSFVQTASCRQLCVREAFVKTFDSGLIDQCPNHVSLLLLGGPYSLTPLSDCRDPSRLPTLYVSIHLAHSKIRPRNAEP